MSSLAEDIAELYHQLIPSKEEGLLIFRLHEKIKSGETDTNFSIYDIQRAIDETYKFNLSNQPNRERLLKNLLNYFIERPAEQRNSYCLTEYARKFVLLIDHKLNNPFRKFPLRESFKRYMDFSAQDIQHINQFESWFNQGFQATTRQNIFDHLEELKAEVHSSIGQLNKLLYSTDETVLKMVADFSIIFTDLGIKADEIRDTLRLGNTLKIEIEQVVNLFYERTQNFSRPTTPDEQGKFDELHNAYNRSEQIQQEIGSFFDTVDQKLGQLRERIQYASTKLNELHDLFRYKSQFKLNLKRLLEYVLGISIPDKSQLILTRPFPLKYIVEERFRLTLMPDLEKEVSQRNTVVILSEDTEHHQKELLKLENELLRQQRIHILVNQYKKLLEANLNLDLTEIFYKTIEDENDDEIALQLSYELIQLSIKNPVLQIEIKHEILERYLNHSIITWKTNINSQT